jgi:hypothetical protein
MYKYIDLWNSQEKPELMFFPGPTNTPHLGPCAIIGELD